MLSYTSVGDWGREAGFFLAHWLYYQCLARQARRRVLSRAAREGALDILVLLMKDVNN